MQSFTHSIAVFMTAVFILLLPAGCTRLGPDFTGIANPPVPGKWKNNHAAHDESIIKWWRTFNDPTLNSLVKKVYGRNLDIRSAGLRIAQARAVLGISRGFALPQKQTLSGRAESTHSGLMDFNSVGVNFDMGWELDLWGKYGRAIEAARAALYASVASYDNIMVSVIAEVARNYISYRTAQERLIYARRNVNIQKRVVTMTEVQFNSGNVSELDMQQARSQLYSTRAAIAAIQLDQVKAANALALLLDMEVSDVMEILNRDGTEPEAADAAFLTRRQGVIQLSSSKGNRFEANLVPVPSLDPGFAIDADLITRRPDIKVAEYTVHVNSARLGAGMADLYPGFSLFGNIGYNNTDKAGAWLTGTEPLAVVIGPSFSWNIFNYGRIKNRIRLQDAVFEESLVNYNKAVLAAVAEVEDTLSGYVLTLRQQHQNRKALLATMRAFNLSAIQYNEGLVSYQRLLTTVEKLTLVQDRFATIKGGAALYAVALYKALGGGWQINRGRSYISRKTAQRMRERTDWGTLLDEDMTRIPRGFYDHE
ncbi:MAG TPA: TolC family protein [Desulfobulbaceae bacterium]|nr:TolC family protein [Desulfobulbaceae bacterium]